MKEMIGGVFNPMNILKIKDRQELDRRVPAMPWYVEKFINFKLPDLSPSSLLEYVRDYESFLAGCWQKAWHRARAGLHHA